MLSYLQSMYALQTATPNQCALASLDMARVRAYLGISSNGHIALIATALLLGGDYHMRGAERIGPRQVQAPPLRTRGCVLHDCP